MNLPIMQFLQSSVTSSLLFSSAPCSHAFSVYVLPLVSEIIFHTHTAQNATDKLILYRAQLRLVDPLFNYFSIMRLNRSVILE
jgi:hypothetical protein